MKTMNSPPQNSGLTNSRISPISNAPTRRGGFTLLEILVVVLIITILATVVGVHVAREPGKARVSVARANIVMLREALQLYRMHHGIYPTQEQGLTALVRCPEIPPVPQGYPDEGYLVSRNVPPDPWGNPFVYLVPGAEGQPFELISYGADGEPGGVGEFADLTSADL